jgi:type I restriction enzyme M protein
MLSSETKRRIDSCRGVLVGLLPLPTDQVELITLALIYKFMDDLDEQSVQQGGIRSFFIKELADFRWRSLMSQTVSASDRVRLFANGIEALSDPKTGKHLPEMFRDIFRNARLKIFDGRILNLFMTELDGFAYSHSEELGNAFEYLLQSMGAQGENGQFRTPRHIIDFIVEVLEPKPEDKILDPACGTGGFLVSAYKHILGKHTSKGSSVPGDQLSPAKKEKLTKHLCGYDITPMMVKLSKVNMFLHDFSEPQIHEYDTLSNDARWNEKADVILANPPFMTPKGGVKPHSRFRITSKKAEVLFTDYISEHLTPNGRAGIIVPEGIIFQKQKAYKALRKYLIEDSLIAAISLPDGVFNPYSPSKTTILILDKGLASKTTTVAFFEISNDGFDLGAQRRAITENDLPEVKKEIKAYLEAIKDGKKYSSDSKLISLVERSTIFEHKSISLLANIYQKHNAKQSHYPIARLEDLIDIDYGTRITKKGHIGTKYPVYGGGGESFRTNSYTHENTVVISRFAMSEECVRLVKGKFYLLDSGFTFDVKKMKQDLVSKEYLINYLLVNQELIYKTARGIDQKNIDMDIFKNIPIPVPDKKVQLQLLTKIVEINCDIDKHLKTISDLMKLKHDLFSGVWKD